MLSRWEETRSLIKQDFGSKAVALECQNQGLEAVIQRNQFRREETESQDTGDFVRSVKKLNVPCPLPIKIILDN